MTGSTIELDALEYHPGSSSYTTKENKNKVIRQYVALYQGRNVKKNYLHDL
jgi:hypothetical protein